MVQSHVDRRELVLLHVVSVADLHTHPFACGQTSGELAKRNRVAEAAGELCHLQPLSGVGQDDERQIGGGNCLGARRARAIVCCRKGRECGCGSPPASIPPSKHHPRAIARVMRKEFGGVIEIRVSTGNCGSSLRSRSERKRSPSYRSKSRVVMLLSKNGCP